MLAGTSAVARNSSERRRGVALREEAAAPLESRGHVDRVDPALALPDVEARAGERLEGVVVPAQERLHAREAPRGDLAARHRLRALGQPREARRQGGLRPGEVLVELVVEARLALLDRDGLLLAGRGPGQVAPRAGVGEGEVAVDAGEAGVEPARALPRRDRAVGLQVVEEVAEVEGRPGVLRVGRDRALEDRDLLGAEGEAVVGRQLAAAAVPGDGRRLVALPLVEPAEHVGHHRVGLRAGLGQAGREDGDRVVEEAGAGVVVRRLEGVGVLAQRRDGGGLRGVGGRIRRRPGSRLASEAALAGGEGIERVHGERGRGLRERLPRRARPCAGGPPSATGRRGCAGWRRASGRGGRGRGRRRPAPTRAAPLRARRRRCRRGPSRRRRRPRARRPSSRGPRGRGPGRTAPRRSSRGCGSRSGARPRPRGASRPRRSGRGAGRGCRGPCSCGRRRGRGAAPRGSRPPGRSAGCGTARGAGPRGTAPPRSSPARAAAAARSAAARPSSAGGGSRTRRARSPPPRGRRGAGRPPGCRRAARPRARTARRGRSWPSSRRRPGRRRGGAPARRAAASWCWRRGGPGRPSPRG